MPGMPSMGSDLSPLIWASFFGTWRLGAMICEDMWHGHVTRALVDELIDCLIVINGSPYEIDKLDIRLAHARERVHRSGKPLLYLNMVGGQDELVFDGGSFALDRHGKVIAQLPAFAETVMRVTLTKTTEGIELTAAMNRALVWGVTAPFSASARNTSDRSYADLMDSVASSAAAATAGGSGESARSAESTRRCS